MARVLLATFGSLGDLHPYIAVGRALRARGHRARIATSSDYRPNVEAAGLEFAAVAPSLAELGTPQELARRVADPHARHPDSGPGSDHAASARIPSAAACGRARCGSADQPSTHVHAAGGRRRAAQAVAFERAGPGQFPLTQRSAGHGADQLPADRAPPGSVGLQRAHALHPRHGAPLGATAPPVASRTRNAPRATKSWCSKGSSHHGARWRCSMPR